MGVQGICTLDWLVNPRGLEAHDEYCVDSLVLIQALWMWSSVLVELSQSAQAGNQMQAFGVGLSSQVACHVGMLL